MKRKETEGEKRKSLSFIDDSRSKFSFCRIRHAAVRDVASGIGRKNAERRFLERYLFLGLTVETNLRKRKAVKEKANRFSKYRILENNVEQNQLISFAHQ